MKALAITTKCSTSDLQDYERQLVTLDYYFLPYFEALFLFVQFRHCGRVK